MGKNSLASQSGQRRRLTNRCGYRGSISQGGNKFSGSFLMPTVLTAEVNSSATGGVGICSHITAMATRFLEKHHDGAARLVILPAHDRGQRRSSWKNFHRALRSFVVNWYPMHIAAQQLPVAEVFAADDVALSLDTQYVSGWQLISSALAAPRAYLSVPSNLPGFRQGDPAGERARCLAGRPRATSLAHQFAQLGPIEYV